MFLPYVSRWESDLATPTDLEDWSKVWSSVAKCSFNTVTLEAAYNVLLCWYWVPTRIAHLNPPYRQMFSGLRPAQGRDPHLVVFWSRVFGLLTHFRRDTRHALLHWPIPGRFSYHQKLATYLFIATKRAIARAWKKPSIRFAEVKSIPTTLMIHEKVTSILQDSHSKFIKVWAPWWFYALWTLHLTSMGSTGQHSVLSNLQEPLSSSQSCLFSPPFFNFSVPPQPLTILLPPMDGWCPRSLSFYSALGPRAQISTFTSSIISQMKFIYIFVHSNLCNCPVITILLYCMSPARELLVSQIYNVIFFLFNRKHCTEKQRSSSKATTAWNNSVVLGPTWPCLGIPMKANRCLRTATFCICYLRVSFHHFA